MILAKLAGHEKFLLGEAASGGEIIYITRERHLI